MNTKEGELYQVELDESKKYLHGFQNSAIRYYFYLEQGLNILNEFRNLFLGLIALYIGLHLTNLLWILVLIIPSIIVLTIVGWYMVHKVAKVKEWVNIRFSTHFAIRNFDYSKDTVAELKEIRRLLEDNKNGNS